MKTLPTYYYLDHFLEMLSYLRSRCWHLLNDEQHTFIEQFYSWEKAKQCTFVRVNNRKSLFIDLNKFDYPEISNIDEHLSLLLAEDLISPLQEEHKNPWCSSLNKTQLFEALHHAGMQVPAKSTSKQALLSIAIEQLKDVPISEFPEYHRYQYNQSHQLIEFFQFLFFGNLRNGHEQFSMRDLGVMRTRKDKHAGESIFTSAEEASNSFIYRKQLQALRESDSEFDVTDWLDKFEKLPRPVAEQDKHYRDAFLYELGLAVLGHDVDTALELWAQSDDPRSTEKWCREAYKAGYKAQVGSQLKKILANPDSLELCAFANDFYRLKFKKQKRTKATSMLLDAKQTLYLDEAYIGSPEEGVKQALCEQGKQVFNTENRLWRSLFGLTFFELLYLAPQNKPSNAFSDVPVALKQGTFMQNSAPEINGLVDLFNSPLSAMKHLTRMATKYYGEKNAIFRWSKKVLERLHSFLEHAPPDAVQAHLLAMCQSYTELKDGYPDLMVIDNQGLSFVEVKAPNDSIRRNQITTIQHLQNFGFKVEIAALAWRYNPEQKYSVVDIETTGGRSGNHRITEIGIATVQNGKIINTWQTLINPTRHIPSFITKLTGISNEMVKDAPLFSEIANELREQLNNSIFVAHNVNFDFGFIKSEFERLGEKLSLPKVCTVREMRKYFPGQNSYSLGSLSKAYDLPLENHHRALDDAIAAAHLLLMVNEKKQENLMASEQSNETAMVTIEE